MDRKHRQLGRCAELESGADTHGGGAGGVATLGGTLNIVFTNGFKPTNGATFTFLTAQNRVGAFSTFNYPTNEVGMEINYDLTSAKATVVNLRPVVTNPITNPPAGTYGTAFNFQFPANTFSDPDNDPLSYSASGLPPGISFVPETRTFSGTPSQAGVFSVTVVAHDGGTPNLIATNNFNITVTPATLAIAANPQSKLYGAADPTLAYTVDGLQLGDVANNVLTGALGRYADESAANSPYAITQGTLAANSNYSISFTGGTLTITRVLLSVAVNAATKVFGEADPAFTASYAGFVNGETSAALGGSLTFTRVPGEGVGSYPITPAGLLSDNYTITFNIGALTITAPAPQVISLAIVGSTNIGISWTAVSNAAYRIDYKPTLTETNWTDLGGDVVSTGDTATKLDTTASTSIARYYRVKVVP